MKGYKNFEREQKMHFLFGDREGEEDTDFPKHCLIV